MYFCGNSDLGNKTSACTNVMTKKVQTSAEIICATCRMQF